MCGDFNSAALSDSGEIYSWGGGGKYLNKGQLGHGNFEELETPLPIKFFQNEFVVRISCGGYHMLALTERGELYGWGSGTYGECGQG
ncbi:MAG: hypothetical protein ACK56F_18115, partial [bacterium]